MVVAVNHDSLLRVLEEYVEGFNDCACCPCYHWCEKHNKFFGDIELYDCSRLIRDHFLEARQEVK